MYMYWCVTYIDAVFVVDGSLLLLLLFMYVSSFENIFSVFFFFGSATSFVFIVGVTDIIVCFCCCCCCCREHCRTHYFPSRHPTPTALPLAMHLRHTFFCFLCRWFFYAFHTLFVTHTCETSSPLVCMRACFFLCLCCCRYCFAVLWLYCTLVRYTSLRFIHVHSITFKTV